ncbi:MAG: hypothetical protein QF830_04660 [Rhodospirillales bacterium]|jgi:hypothetical protein|nr:hypothetical protein [Rhodospirillales bacterium]MDP6883406.1 hypothetical protein [Rhodospirillales bacterium]
MKTKDIVKSLGAALDLDNKKKKKKADALRKILKKLKKKEINLKERRKAAKSGKEKSALAAKLKVNRAHRKKGVKVLRKLSGKG